MTELAHQVEPTIEARKLIRRGERILIAVSGGVDSMVLLDVLQRLAPAHAWKLSVAHFNHQLRGRSSETDERLVRETARRLKLPIVVDRGDVRGLATKEKISVEMAARKARHEFLAKTAAGLKISKIALAHHADDQLELFFLRLFRGAGAEGLGGMKWQNGSPHNSHIQLIRPLLNQTKSALRGHADEAGVRFREDATNDSLDLQRNRIRHELLPLLREKYQPALERIVPRVMDIIHSEGELVRDIARAWRVARRAISLPREFEKLPVALQRRCIQLQLIEKGWALDFEQVEELRRHADSVVTLEGDVNVYRDSDGILHSHTKHAVSKRQKYNKVQINKDGGTRFDGTQIAWKLCQSESATISKPGKGVEFFDADKIGPKITLRHWQAGDRFQPIGMGNSIKLQDFFTNQKIPRARRHNLILGVTESGEVFWIEDMRISEQFKLTNGTIRRLQWQWKRL